MKKILVFVTNVAKYPHMNRPTGLWLGEAVHFVEKVEAAGFQVDFVSPQGGYTPIDPASLGDMALPIDWEFYQNTAFMDRLGATLRPSQVNPRDYAAVYLAGGHGVIWDFPDDAGLQSLCAQIYEAGGIVASVCHGAVGLLNITLANGKRLIEGKQVTGFSNHEEQLAQLDEHVPFLTENELKNRGGLYQKADQPFTEFVVVDERLVTGQNPQSGGAVATEVLAILHPSDHGSSGSGNRDPGATGHRPATMVPPGTGRRLGVVGDVYRFLATGADTDGKYATFEAIVPPGSGPPPHIHSREEESFLVLEGEITFQLGGDRIVAPAGTFLNMPIGSLHRFQNESQQTARMLISVAPAGLEQMFFEVGQPLGETQMAAPPSPAEIERLLAAAPSYGLTIQAPPHA